jgi:hypothetical protein
MILDVEIRPKIDWDLFICELLPDGSHNGGTLAWGVGHWECDNPLAQTTPSPWVARSGP